MKKPKVIICAEYLFNTGFSCVAENIAKNLIEDFEVIVVDYSRTYDFFLKNDGVSVIGAKDEDSFGDGRVIDLMQNADCLFIINDAWNIDTILEKIKLSGKRIPPIVAYFPVDAEQHCAAWYKHFDIVTFPVTYTSFAANVVKVMSLQFRDSGISDALMGKLCVVPHGMNLGVYSQMDKLQAREELFKTEKYNDAYIVLNANRNQPRKRLDITMLAFSIFAKKYDKPAYLYMHSAISDASINPIILAKRYGIEDKLILSVPLDSNKLRPSFSEETMNLMYNACDVGINTGLGEGWGLTAVEHACTGAPQIIPNHSACAEIFNGIGNFIDIQAPIMLDNIMTLAYLPSVDSAAKQIELLSDEGERGKYSKMCLDKFSNRAWDWKFLCEKAWIPIISNAINSSLQIQSTD